MATEPKDGKYIYHLTPLENLESIITHGLLPRNEVFDFKDIASAEILLKRSDHQLEGFVPFHFFAKTPFCGNVEKNNPGLHFIYLAVKRHHARIRNFKIIPSHPVNYGDEPLDWEAGMEAINWDLMALKDYSNHECKEVCMAEALFMGALKISEIDYIYTKADQVTAYIMELLAKHKLINLKVSTNQHMFVRND